MTTTYWLAHRTTGEVLEITDPRWEVELREGNEQWAEGLTRFDNLELAIAHVTRI